jgi:hypothetical protein
VCPDRRGLDHITQRLYLQIRNIKFSGVVENVKAAGVDVKL